MKDRKKIVEAVFFVTVTVLALSVLFRGQNWHSLFLLVRKSNPVCLLFAVFLGLLFVCMEGYMIWRLLRLSGNDATLPGCIRYSFVGYFYSGITPSATGGQPAQLYEMCKDGNNASDSTVVLMVVALFYKLVLVVIGLMLPVVWLGHMKEYLGSWLGLYVVGIVLNVVLVALICGVMFSPGLILNIMCGVLAAGERCGIVKNGEKLRQDAAVFARRYRETTHFLKAHKGELVVTGAVTFLQRSTVFLITGMVYLGFGLSGSSLFHILAVQAAVYIAVDILPVPGAQGITELMYAAVFGGVFGTQYVKASMLLVRGMDFYVPFGVSMLVVLAGHGVSYVRRQREQV